MTPTPFDFRRPPPGSLEQSLRAWLSAAGRSSGKAWSKLLPFAAEFEPESVSAVANPTIDEPVVAFPLTTNAPADGTAMLGLPRPLLLFLVGGLFGEASTQFPEDRDLTDIEASATGHVIRECFLSILETSWPGAATLAWSAGPMQPPRSVLQPAGADMTLHAKLNVVTPHGPKTAHLMLPRSGRWEELARSARIGIAPVPEPERMSALVREMPVEVSVRLGTADLTMSEVARLRDGDVVVFRQKVDEPLAAAVSGAMKYRVWPGTLGNRVAFQIDSVEPV